METKILDEFVGKTIASCNCQKSKLNELEQIRLMIKEKQRNNERCKPTQELSQYFQSSVPDLKIICGDGMIIMSHKLLLGLTNECLAEIFNEEDFINDPLTVLKIPNSPGDRLVNLLNRLSEQPFEEDILDELFFTNKVDTKPLDTQTLQPEDSSEENINSNLDNLVPCLEVKDEPEPDIKTDCSSEEEDFISEKQIQQIQIQRPSSKKINCPVCRKSYGSDYYRRIHKLKCQDLGDHHKDRITNEKKKKCYKCNSFVWKLERHLEECGKILDAELKPSLKSREGAGDPVACDQCGKVVTNKYCLKIHIESVHNPDKQVHSCDRCPYTTTYKRNLMLHIKNIHEAGEFIACHICGVKIKGGAGNLSRHIFRLHTESQTERVKCEECGKEVKASHLNNHRTKVHGERKFACHMCSYRAQTGYNLKLHISKSHLGVKELPKDQCQYCDVVTTNLPHHMKLFHGDK